MTGETIKEFLVALGFDIDEAGAKKFASTITGATLAAGALGAAMVAAGAAVVHFVNGQAEQLDKLDDFADQVDESSAAIMEMGYVASLNDSNLESLESSIQGVTRAAGESIIGLGRGALAFKKLGINAKDSQGNVKGGVQLLTEIGDKIRDLPRAQQLATLGKLNIDPNLLKTITRDASAVRAEFEKVYGSLGLNAEALQQATKDASDYEDSATALGFVWDAVRKAVAIKLIPQLKRGMDSLRKSFVDNLPKIYAVALPVFQLFLNMAEAVVTLGLRVAGFAGRGVELFSRLNAATHGWAGYILAAAAAWKVLNLSMLASPIGLLFVLGAAVLALVDDFLTWQEGGESLIDWGSDFGVTLQVVAGFVAALAATIATVKTAMLLWAAANAVWTGIQGAMTLAAVAFDAAMSPWLLTIGAVLLVLAALGAAAYTVMQHWDEVKTWFTGFFQDLLDGFNLVSGAAGKVAGLFGFGGGGAPAPAMLTPSPATAAAMGGSQQNVSQKTEINITGVTDPKAAGQAVVGAQDRVNADMARNTQRGIR